MNPHNLKILVSECIACTQYNHEKCMRELNVLKEYIDKECAKSDMLEREAQNKAMKEYINSKPKVQCIKFPEDFTCTGHPIVPGGVQYLYTKPNGTKISIVGGAQGLYGDGINTFEMFDFDKSEPDGFLTIDEINAYLGTL